MTTRISHWIDGQVTPGTSTRTFPRDRDTREPLVPYNASGPAATPMAEFAAACKQLGLWPSIHFNRTHIAPPCTSTPEEISQGLVILDEALTVADRYYTGTW